MRRSACATHSSRARSTRGSAAGRLAATGLRAVRAARRRASNRVRTRAEWFRGRVRGGRVTRESPVIGTWEPPGEHVLLQLGHAGRRGATRPHEAGSTCRSRTAGRSSLRRESVRAVRRDPRGAGREGGVRAVPRRRATGGRARCRRAPELRHGPRLPARLLPLAAHKRRGRPPSLPTQPLEAVRQVWPRVLAVRLSSRLASARQHG